MKKLFTLMLALWMALCTFSVGAFAANDDGWSTYTGTIQNSNLTYTFKAKGNEIKIEITGDDINGDQLTCPGTKDAKEDELWGKADGNIMHIMFRDGQMEDGGNDLDFEIRHDCGEDAASHTVSLKNDVRFCLSYTFYKEKDATGQDAYYSAVIAPGYGGKWGSEGCSKLQLSVSEHTLTMTTTLPDQIVDYKHETTRDLRLKSDSLSVNGCLYPFYHTSDPKPTDPPEKQNLIRKIINRAREIFAKFIALFRKLFGIQEAKPSEQEKLYYNHSGNTVTVYRLA